MVSVNTPRHPSEGGYFGPPPWEKPRTRRQNIAWWAVVFTNAYAIAWISGVSRWGERVALLIVIGCFSAMHYMAEKQGR